MSSSKPTLAHTVAYAVCEAISRFSEQVQPVTAKFVKHKPSAAVPSISSEDKPELKRSLDLFSQASQELTSVKEASKEKVKELKEKEQGARKRLADEIERTDEKRARVQLEKPAPVPSSLRSVAPLDAESEEESEEESDDEKEFEKEDDDEKKSKRSVAGSVVSVRSTSSFVVGQQTKTVIDKSKKPLSQIQLRGIVLAACRTALREHSVNPDAPAQRDAVTRVLANFDFWERVLDLVQKNVKHAEDSRRIQTVAVYIKEEKRRPHAEEGGTFLDQLIRTQLKK